MAARQPLDHPAAQIASVLSRIYRQRLTTTSGGNLSIRDDSGGGASWGSGGGEGRIWITPAGRDKGSLRAADVACVLPDGSCASRYRPSSELPFHRAIYKVRPDLRAIVHAHPPALVAFSIARKVPPTAILPQVCALCGRPAYVRYALTGSAELGARIAAAFAKGANCAILENHGVVVAASDMDLAYARFEALECAAQVALLAAGLGEVKTLSPWQLREATEKLGGTASRGATDKRSLPRRSLSVSLDVQQDTDKAPKLALSVAPRAGVGQVHRFLTRGREQGLLAIAGFSFSLRLSHDSFLMGAPAGGGPDLPAPAFRPMSTADVLAAGTIRGPWNWRLHQSIYRKHPRIGAAIFAAPPHATAFAVTGTALDARTIPESYLLLRQVATAPFKDWINAENLAAQVSLDQPALLLQNGGALVVGRTMLEAFDRLEVLESTAAALTGAQPLGGCRPMEPARLRELRTAFPGLDGGKED